MIIRPIAATLCALAVVTLAACTSTPSGRPGSGRSGTAIGASSAGSTSTVDSTSNSPAGPADSALPAPTSELAPTDTTDTPGDAATPPPPTSQQSQAPRPSAPTAEAADLPAGLYGMAAWRPSTTGRTTSFSTAGACTGVLETLAAGQWLTTTLATPADLPKQLREIMPWYLVSLTRGPQSAYLKLIQGAHDCDGVLTVATEQEFSMTGADKHDATASFTPFQCGPNPFDRESMMLTGFYDTDDVHLLANLTFPARKGAHAADADEEIGSLQVVRGGRSMLERYGAAFASLALTDGEDSERVPGATVLRASEQTRMSVTATSLYPLDGTVRLSAVRGDDGRKLDLTLGFHCDTTPLPEPAAQEEETEPAVPLDGDAPASTDGQGSVTVTVASGPRKGTYTGTGSLKCHHHKFGPDSWWLLYSSDSEDPDAVTMINLWSQPKGKITKSSVYSEPFLLDVGFGVFVLDTTKQMHVNADVGGTGGTVTVHGNTVTATAITADKVTVTVIAECS